MAWRKPLDDIRTKLPTTAKGRVMTVRPKLKDVNRGPWIRSLSSRKSKGNQDFKWKFPTRNPRN
jgi:hypothetical protein